jgi:zinc transport system substrate-binding protein
VEIESDTALNASEIADIIKLVQDGKVKLLFTELQYSDTIANRIEEETDAKVYIIDSGVTGDGSKDSYLKAMEHNLSVLKDALK